LSFGFRFQGVFEQFLRRKLINNASSTSIEFSADPHENFILLSSEIVLVCDNITNREVLSRGIHFAFKRCSLISTDACVSAVNAHGWRSRPADPGLPLVSHGCDADTTDAGAAR
jgi:hypothetical protein